MDGAVAAEALRFLAPLGIAAALRLIEVREADCGEAGRQIELALTQARYEADLARRQYDAVDPGNRLVAAELERRWNDRLVEAHRLEEKLVAVRALSWADPQKYPYSPRDASVWAHSRRSRPFN